MYVGVFLHEYMPVRYALHYTTMYVCMYVCMVPCVLWYVLTTTVCTTNVYASVLHREYDCLCMYANAVWCALWAAERTIRTLHNNTSVGHRERVGYASSDTFWLRWRVGGSHVVKEAQHP